MKVGCFSIIDPFQPVEHQLDRIAELGFKHADVTDNHPGALLGKDIFTPTVSLDENPLDVKRKYEDRGLTITSVAAHGNLLDPSCLSKYGTSEISKAVKLAANMDVEHVITTEGEPLTEWGENLTFDERVFIIAEKLYEPLRLAEDLGVKILLENHGPITDTIEGLEAVMDRLDEFDNLEINLDTGNSWLGGADPVEMAKRFQDKIGHVHWKDLPSKWEEKRGDVYGTGFAPIALGEGVIDIEGVAEVVSSSPAEYSTLEIAGDDNLVNSKEYLIDIGIVQES